MKQATSLILIVTVAVILLLIPTSITASGVEDTHEHRRESQIVEGAESIHTADHFIGDMVESTADAPKTNWPELVGMSGEQAKATIMSENSSVTEIQILPAGSIVTMDYREDRVRIFVDGNGNVSVSPSIG
uniref:Subtilisin inhibitor domain-containing protein n=1 Tax=Craspedostauros australis TaxID=1486917 RepID=A0A7R9ZMT4_9STRA|mmetsp:Transcript_19542/g.54297  ORF Transcript_19542/g.54297 Transcript_19542/m.54297 type:complete len:131 (+) Transcript_19542:216-608(+)